MVHSDAEQGLITPTQGGDDSAAVDSNNKNNRSRKKKDKKESKISKKKRDIAKSSISVTEKEQKKTRKSSVSKKSSKHKKDKTDSNEKDSKSMKKKKKKKLTSKHSVIKSARDPEKIDWNDEVENDLKINKEDDAADVADVETLKTASWSTQFYWCVWKNALLISRRPMLHVLVMISSVLSLVLSWVVGKDTDDAVYAPASAYTECGTLNPEYVSTLTFDELENLQVTMNDNWTDGEPVALMGLGPLVLAIFSFVLVNDEMTSQLLGVLRALGLRDSVYWMSWFCLFCVDALVNAILGAISAKILPGHIFENVYFGGIFASLFFLNISLISASLFLAAVCGTRKKLFTNLVILCMIVTAFVPFLVLAATASPSWNYDSYDLYTAENPAGLFWQNSDTRRVSPFEKNNVTTCHLPILSEFQGKFYKNEQEREDVKMDEIFIGCYIRASSPFAVWKQEPTKRFLMFFFPYFHFIHIWSSFAGFTAMPGKTFSFAEAKLSQDKLALSAIGASLEEAESSSTFAPQGSTFLPLIDNGFPPMTFYSNEDGFFVYGESTCPSSNLLDFDICPDSLRCGYAQDPGPLTGAPSVLDSFGILFALSLIYLLLTGWWSTAFSSGNGRRERFYFFLLPSYWITTSRVNEVQSREKGVSICALQKSFDSFQAVKDVSFSMNTGEVTALLGHNGAGKTTLSNILCCEIESTGGDIKVFGHSVCQEPFAIRSMVGACKQDDFLWPNLTAKEHLQLFGGLRGMQNEKQEEIVQKWLESVDLTDVQNQYSCTYSGGMKRRLSLALATIGDRPLIVLDEPTTGMDPVSRRCVWRHIDSIKAGRVILLTTHAMEEADLLADEVVIMRKGELAAFGSPLELKTKHGTALQFSLLIDKDKLAEVEKFIDNFFKMDSHWIKKEVGTAGNIVLKISALETESNEGVAISSLTSFVAWLDSAESPVVEYGFSNSSLEEVFLKVTEEDGEDADGINEANDLPLPNNVDEEELVEGDKSAFEDLGRYKSRLSGRNQAWVVFAFLLRRNWTGRSSLGNYLMYCTFLLLSPLIMLTISADENSTPATVGVIFFMSIFLVAIIGPVYADRSGGQFYLMKSQGLLPFGYVGGLLLYAFTISLVYNILTILAVYATPFFRPIGTCNQDESMDDWFFSSCTNYGFGKKELGNPQEVANFEDVYNGQAVTLSALRTPGGFGMAIGIGISAVVPTVGYGLTTAFFPGYRLSLVIIMFCTLVVSGLPILLTYVERSDEFNLECTETVNPKSTCDQLYSRATVDEDFVNCVGFEVSNIASNSFCIQPVAAMLAHFGIYQMFSMAYAAKITFSSSAESYVQDVLIPSLGGSVKCKDETCSFPFANRLYRMNLMFTLLGGILFIGLGFVIVFTFVFPVRPALQFRQRIVSFFHTFSFTKNPIVSNEKEDGEETVERNEVCEERSAVDSRMEALYSEDKKKLTSLSEELRDSLDPVLMHKLRKVYPALGGGNSKVALNSLDLHVTEGEVLGLLGKNGAGKTTALKILAGAHESSGGIGLVSGYNCDTERISVFERLGNCAQFDVVWAGISVQRHLEFFAALKGLPKDKICSAARTIAKAVGLGADAIYSRNAGLLSGGMRRRLSIGMSLLGSPSVVILDEPTTGLDPSTRSSIWSLIHSFASQNNRSMIITTHMMIEADTLCNRIAIISHGNLAVVGTQQHLKNTYGDGYTLQLNLVHSGSKYQDRAMKFVRKKLHPDAKLGIRQAKTLHVTLPRDIKLEKVFRALYSKECSTKGGINQFLLSQSSLEDVFIALGD